MLDGCTLTLFNPKCPPSQLPIFPYLQPLPWFMHKQIRFGWRPLLALLPFLLMSSAARRSQ